MDKTTLSLANAYMKDKKEREETGAPQTKQSATLKNDFAEKLLEELAVVTVEMYVDQPEKMVNELKNTLGAQLSNGWFEGAKKTAKFLGRELTEDEIAQVTDGRLNKIFKIENTE